MQGLGPAAAALVFFTQGNDWSVDVSRPAAALACATSPVLSRARHVAACYLCHAEVCVRADGSRWCGVQRLRMVMLCGMVLALVPAALLLLFNDDKTLGEESEGLLKVGLWGLPCRACMSVRPDGQEGGASARSKGSRPHANAVVLAAVRKAQGCPH